jgi:hypothetical protein
VLQAHRVDVLRYGSFRAQAEALRAVGFFDKPPKNVNWLGGLRDSSLMGAPDTSSWSRDAHLGRYFGAHRRYSSLDQQTPDQAYFNWIPQSAAT